MKKTLFIFILILFSCKPKGNKIEIFYFNNEFTTPTSVLCNGIFSIQDLKQITIFDTEESDLLVKKIGQLKDNNSYNVDVRRQIIINNDTICFDKFKQLLLNGVSKDSLNSSELYDLVDDLIIKYDYMAKTHNKSMEIIIK